MLGERHPLLGLSGERTSLALSPSTGRSSALLRQSSSYQHHCTDVVFLGFLATYWIGMVALAITVSFTHESSGSFAQDITSGLDSQGQPCGQDRFVYFPDFPVHPDFGFCVDKCPRSDGQVMMVLLPLQTGKRGMNGFLHELQQVHFTSYATRPWAYVCASEADDQLVCDIEKEMRLMGWFLSVYLLLCS